MQLPEDLAPVRGTWRARPDLSVSDIERRNLYRSSSEPSFVAWAVLWKEQTEAVKLSFLEATGDQTLWPPPQDFSTGQMTQYLKTLVSTDGAQTWSDAGWREDCDPLWETDPGHHIRQVSEMHDGVLVRGTCRNLRGRGAPLAWGRIRDPEAAFSAIWSSENGGRSWQRRHLWDSEGDFRLTAVHPIRDGSLVAVGARARDRRDYHAWQGVLSQSFDAGRPWSPLQTIVSNDAALGDPGFSEECNLVEVEDGQLLFLWHTAKTGSPMRQQRLVRDHNGVWQASRVRTHPRFVHPGLPHMCRASDGTIFCYAHTALNYSCDNGDSWGELPLGFTHYGQLTELRPGRMLAVTQKSIGDSPLRYPYGTALVQTVFDFERIAVAEQTNGAAGGAMAALTSSAVGDFYAAAQVRLDGSGGLAYQISGDSYRFVTLIMPARVSRRSASAQNTFLVVGQVAGGHVRMLHRICAGPCLPGAWADLQVTRQGESLKAAVKLPSRRGEWDRGAVSTCFVDRAAAPGRLALWTNQSTGGFRNVCFDTVAHDLRSQWRLYGGHASRLLAVGESA